MILLCLILWLLWVLRKILYLLRSKMVFYFEINFKMEFSFFLIFYGLDLRLLEFSM